MKLLLRFSTLLFVPLALAACKNEDARVAAAFVTRQAMPPMAIAIAFDDGTGAKTFHGTGTAESVYATPTIRTRTRGTLHVTYVLGAAGGEISHGTVDLPLRPDWTWDVRVQVDSANPTRLCMGCGGSASFPLAASSRRVPADSVWVTWGGSSISNPVVY